MFRLVRLARTSIGSKLLLAGSGVVLVAFVTGHMLGNLKVLQGQDALNEYAAWLQGHPLLWVFRVTMLAVLALHVSLGIHLVRENRAARPRGYVRDTVIRTTFAERHMLLSGLLVFVFIGYHLLHLTLGTIDPAHWALTDAAGRPDVYSRVVLGFREPWISASYFGALIVLGLHLQHALRSLFQTLGFSHQSYQSLIDVFCALFPGLLVLGFASIPALVITGVIGLPEGVAP